MINFPHAVEATVIALRDTTVVLSLFDGQTIEWPRELLSEGIEENQVIRLLAFSDHDFETERTEMARHILNEMLQGKKDV